MISYSRTILSLQSIQHYEQAAHTHSGERNDRSRRTLTLLTLTPTKKVAKHSLNIVLQNRAFTLRHPVLCTINHSTSVYTINHSTSVHRKQVYFMLSSLPVGAWSTADTYFCVLQEKRSLTWRRRHSRQRGSVLKLELGPLEWFRPNRDHSHQLMLKRPRLLE